MPSCLSLSSLLLGARAADQPAAIRRGQVRSWQDFHREASQVAAQARAQGGARWVLACEEAWDFAVGFAGLLLAGRTLVLPPNFLPETLERLAAGADGVHRSGPRTDPGFPLEAGTLTGSVEFWTSGTTGEPKAVPKTVAQLEAEVALLEARFGATLGSGPMVGTVPHQHIYGCLFRLLWPLSAGRPFVSEPCGDPLAFREAALLHPVLVSSPAHLARLPRLMDLGALPPLRVFSSGGALGRAEALAWRQWAPAGVVEIYGSTETGGIAWRCQDQDLASAGWTPLPDVAVTIGLDSALEVDCFRAGPAPLRLEDGAEFLPDGRFRLLGRLDRTLKLEEKRVSLPELEAALAGHPLVAQAAVTLLEGVRPTLGAVVVLEQPSALDRVELVRSLRAHLAQRFEPVALPRRWRFPASLPYDDRGKLTAQALGALFVSGRPE